MEGEKVRGEGVEMEEEWRRRKRDEEVEGKNDGRRMRKSEVEE